MKKNILFITTKNLDYIRNVQELKLVREADPNAGVIGSKSSSYLMRLMYVYSKLLFTRLTPYDEIWIGFAPQLVFPFLWRFKKQKIVMDFFISFYDTLCYDRKIIKPNSFVGRIIYFIDQYTLKKADVVICDTNAHRNYFMEEFKVTNKEYRTLYLEADKTIFYPKNTERPPNLQDKYIVLYFGTILPLQGVEVILSSIDKLKEDKHFHFFMIGPMDQKFKERAPMGDNITYIEWLHQKELADYIAMADLCLAGHFNSNIMKASRTIPGKAYIFDAMNKRFILGENSANREIFKESDRVIFVPMGNAEALAEAIRFQINTTEE